MRESIREYHDREAAEQNREIREELSRRFLSEEHQHFVAVDKQNTPQDVPRGTQLEE